MTELLKVHGSQNQFFILDQTTLEQPLTDAELQTLAPRITNPQTGLLGGADGILVHQRRWQRGIHVRQWAAYRGPLFGRKI